MKARIVTLIIDVCILVGTIMVLMLIMKTIFEFPSWLLTVIIFAEIPLMWYINYKLENKMNHGELTKTKGLTNKYPDKYISCPSCGQPVLKDSPNCGFCGGKL